MQQDQTPAMFAAFASELAQIGAGIEGLESLNSDHVRQCAPEVRSQVLKDAQAIDVLTQRLAAMGGLAAALSRGESHQTAVAAVPLADLADRLRAVLLPGSTTAASPAESGEFDLFD